MISPKMGGQICLLFSLLAFFQISQAQVTIGSNEKPNKGTLLDLKENNNIGANSRRGLSLPRVQLKSISSLDALAPNLDKDEHIGLTIYVPEEFENSCPGIYVWTGLQWKGINTDFSRAPESITEKDIDGNGYTAKIFNRKGCKGGTYWFTSNLRTTRKNDGTAFHRPLYFTAAKAINYENPFDEDNIANFNQVKSKSDISTSTTANKMITYYLNNQEIKMTQDVFVSKFGLQYTYYMAHPRDGETEEDVKICPVGWKVPLLADWAKLLEEVSGITGVTGKGVPYLFANDDIYEPDGREIFADGDYIAEPGSFLINAPKKMGGFPDGDEKNSGLNIYPAGSIRVQDTASPAALDGSFGSRTFILEKGNGAIGLYSGKETLAGGMIAAYKAETEYGSVRCIKVVE